MSETEEVTPQQSPRNSHQLERRQPPGNGTTTERSEGNTADLGQLNLFTGGVDSYPSGVISHGGETL